MFFTFDCRMKINITLPVYNSNDIKIIRPTLSPCDYIFDTAILNTT